MNDAAIRVEGLGKRYRLGEVEPYLALRDVIARSFKRLVRRFAGRGEDGARSPGHVWALKEVSFEVRRGEVVGVIGRNGAGKTTALKILAGITKPTEGRAEIEGKVGSLLEVGTGFHPELTGRENVYLNGAILGMGRSEIDQKFDAILSFAEVERFVDTPVKFYSTGMQLRLAFAVAAHLEPDILLVDEVLAVGDSAFQRKCMGKMEEAARGGRTILFVSHNMGAIVQLCSRAILLDSGRVLMDSDVASTIDAYMRGGNISLDTAHVVFDRDASLPCSITGIETSNSAGESCSVFDLSDEIVISVEYEVIRKVHDLLLNITLSRNLVDVVTSFDTDQHNPIPAKMPGRYVTRYRLPAMFLKAGSYSVTVGAGTPTQSFQVYEDATRFEVEELSQNTRLRGYRKDRPGHVISPGTWETLRTDV